MQTDSPEMIYHGRRTVWQTMDPREIWRFRDLVGQFALRDLKVRYRQTVVGALWAIIQPVVTMLVFGGLFSALNGKPTTSDVPYPITSLCGLIPWQFFAAAIVAATQSVSMNAQIVQKVYFPKVILPFASLLPPLVDLLIATAVLALLMLFYGIFPGWPLLALPLVFMATFLTTLACALWLSAVNAIYRDVQYVVPFLVSTGLLVSPVTYELSAATERMSPTVEFIYCVNPFANLLTASRWAVLGTPLPPLLPAIVSGCLVLILFVSGVYYFGKIERFFADRV